ncbi:hypothetical protein [Streptomyces sp. NPDC049944]|uniref:hypothetical protein n=1 Tax=Streptomyces sp. NPDC049944 TaxID=3155657 RepID=UPI003414CB95
MPAAEAVGPTTRQAGRGAMDHLEVFQLAGRGPQEMSVVGVVIFGLTLPAGILVGANIGHAADRVYDFLLLVLPGPVEEVSPRSLRAPGWVIAFLSLVGLVLEVRTGLS